MMRLERLAAAAGVIGVLTLSACGSSGSGSGASGEIDRSTDQIISDTAAAIKGAHSFHMHGNFTSGGDAVGLDLHIGGPQSVSGSITLKGTTAKLVLVNGDTYIQGKEFFAVFGNAQAAALVGDNWVKLPASAASSVQTSFALFADTSTFSHCFLSTGSGTSLNKSASTLNGVAVIELTGGGSTLDVAATGPTYPLRVSGSGGSSGSGLGTKSSDPACSPGGASGSASGSSSSGSGGSGAILFDSWGVTVTVTPPPGALDLSSFGG
ncbi:MAG TPA: hypothetical protein VI316_07250 [Candidatus Dormibacteraeota bacterium]